MINVLSVEKYETPAIIRFVKQDNETKIDKAVEAEMFTYIFKYKDSWKIENILIIYKYYKANHLQNTLIHVSLTENISSDNGVTVR